MSEKCTTPVRTWLLLLDLYKSQVRQKMECCCHIWAGAAQSSLSSLDRIQKHLCSLVGDKLLSALWLLSPQTKRCKLLAALSLIPWKMSQWAIFLSCTNSRLSQLKLAMSCTLRRNIFSPFLFHLWEVSFTWTASHELLLCGTDSQEDAFLNNYNLNLFTSRVNRYFSHISS